jgi:hypothetical protein
MNAAGPSRIFSKVSFCLALMAGCSGTADEMFEPPIPDTLAFEVDGKPVMARFPEQAVGAILNSPYDVVDIRLLPVLPLGFSLVMNLGTPLGPGTYPCKHPTIHMIHTGDGIYFTSEMGSCSVTFQEVRTDASAKLVGTFSAVLADSRGGSLRRHIGNGRFSFSPRLNGHTFPGPSP